MSDLWKKAVLGNWTFESSKMQLNVIQLAALPLEAKDGFDLDSVAVKLNNALKESGEVSFVKDVSTQSEMLREKLEFVKLVIAHKKDMLLRKHQAAKASKELATLTELLANIENKNLEKLSEGEILARIEKLREQVPNS